MSFVKKIEVKYHPSPRLRKETHFGAPANEADAPGYALPGFSNSGLPEVEADAIKANPSDFAADFFGEHSSPVAVARQAEPLTGLLKGSSHQAHTAARSAQA
ncbi:MAG TPA: hypothetical protein VL986_09050 [Terracidiphilus sp.]|nr:hypothetical protein [Terracidiphilus sp.]